MPFLLPIVAWLAELSAAQVAGAAMVGVGLGGIALNSISENGERIANASKNFVQNSLIPAAIIGGLVYYFVNKSKK